MEKGFQLSIQQKKLLKQGVKLKFKTRFGQLLNVRIECLCCPYDKSTAIYSCAESNYDSNGLTKHGQAMQFYNSFDTECFYTVFEVYGI